MTRRQPAPAAPEPVGPIPDCDRLWSPPEVAAFLGIPVATLHQWRYLGTGPAAYRVGRHLRYDPAIVRRWLAENYSTGSGAA
jgi:hypothetical protein